MTQPILFYSPFCPICPGVIVACVDYFNQKGIPLLIKMPDLKEKKLVKNLPALFLPRESGDFEQSYILIGENIPDWLRTMDQKINGN